jgi:hypothetical protein
MVSNEPDEPTKVSTENCSNANFKEFNSQRIYEAICSISLGLNGSLGLKSSMSLEIPSL